jgi:hypothetical protein
MAQAKHGFIHSEGAQEHLLFPIQLKSVVDMQTRIQTPY